MLKRMYCSLLLSAASLAPLCAASRVDLVAAEYSAPAVFEVAPGQVVTLSFRGVSPRPDRSLRSGKAQTATLPTSIAGVSAKVFQGSQSYQVPMFWLTQENECGDTQPIHPRCVLTDIRVQIPFELSLAPNPDSPSLAAPTAYLAIDADGHASTPIPIQPVTVSSHVLTTCDLNPANRAGTCERAAYHADGARVTAAAPAKRDEVITVYMYGLGPTWPPVPAGVPSPAGAEIGGSGVLRVWTTVRNDPVNASPVVDRFFNGPAAEQPGSPGLEFAGLAPGMVGVYQLNVRVPSSFEILMPCGPDVHANALVLVTTREGSVPVPFCVRP